MLSRKQFLNEILIQVARALASFGKMPEYSEPCQDSDFLKFTELSPSLLRIEAERSGVDLSRIDEAGLRSKIYDTLRQKCSQPSDSPSDHKINEERREEWNDLAKAT